jgi:hypothetical protein
MKLVSKLMLAALAVMLFAGSVDAQPMGYSFRGYPSRADPLVNQYLSARYDHLLQVSWRFRRHRMWRECHPISWPGLRGECLASFDQYEPFIGRAYR